MGYVQWEISTEYRVESSRIERFWGLGLGFGVWVWGLGYDNE